jgi:hypothetical protein
MHKYKKIKKTFGTAKEKSTSKYNFLSDILSLN